MLVKVSTLHFQIRKASGAGSAFTDCQGNRISHAWYIYERTFDTYLCLDLEGTGLVLDCSTGYARSESQSILCAPGWYRTRELARFALCCAKSKEMISIRSL